MIGDADHLHAVSYQPLLESEDYDLGIVGRSDAMQNVFKLIGQLAASDATALITGIIKSPLIMSVNTIQPTARSADTHMQHLIGSFGVATSVSPNFLKRAGTLFMISTSAPFLFKTPSKALSSPNY